MGIEFGRYGIETMMGVMAAIVAAPARWTNRVIGIGLVPPRMGDKLHRVVIGGGLLFLPVPVWSLASEVLKVLAFQMDPARQRIWGPHR